MNYSLFFHQKQNGAVLVVGLILLLAMTLLAITGSTNSLITTRLANNATAKNNSFQAANAALDLTIHTCLDQAKNDLGNLVTCTLPNPAVTATILAKKSPIMIGTSAEISAQSYTVQVETTAVVNGITTRLAMGTIAL